MEISKNEITKILIGDEISSAILNCKPSRIAVAYIGADWDEFIPDICAQAEVIVSPTFGTNPHAVDCLVNKLGWDNVLFLRELHAKVYIGKDSAVVGSSNLTRNGLSGERLVEVCVEVGGAENLGRLNAVFDSLKRLAQNQYQDVNSKKKCLAELERTWGAAVSSEICIKSINSETFSGFELYGDDHFYVSWYREGCDCEYSDELERLQAFIDDEVHFAREDRVEKNKWVLSWSVTREWMPSKKTKPSWVYIHDVFPGGAAGDKDYPKCAIQWSDRKRPNPPFELTPGVVDAFRQAISEKNIAKHLIQKDEVFNLANSFEGLPLLVKRMKEILDNKL